MTLEQIIQGCQKENRQAQRLLYDQYAAILFGICRRYLKQNEDAEDLFQEGFFKILSKVNDYKAKGSFEGWMKRIMVNECLMHLRKRKHFLLSIESDNVQVSITPTVMHDLAYADVIAYLDLLPTGYRTVFNLYCVEGYKHREIGELLGISINTSKSQLILAKKRLRDIIKKKQNKAV